MAAAAWVVFGTKTYGSPDEAANAFFIRQLATAGTLSADSSQLPAGSGEQSTSAQLAYWHPRSMQVDGQKLKPGSFLGLVLVGGTLDFLTFNGAHRLLTPSLALVGLWALYLILRRFWNQWWALLGSSLVALHPVWWQFQTRPWFHNGAFASLLVMAGWRLLRLWEEGTARNAAWFGLAFGAALFFRPVEVIWAGPLVAIVLLAQRQWRNLVIAATITLFVQLPWLISGWQLYGPSLGAGYSAAQLDTEPVSVGDAFSPLPGVFVPPGGWSWNWMQSAWWYLVMMVPVWSAATAVALMFYFLRLRTQRLKMLKIILVGIILAYFLSYYGSWDLYPLEPPTRVGSLASYARYWLPLYVAMVVGVLWVLKRLRRFRLILAASIIALLTSQTVAILFHPTSGLVRRLKSEALATTKRQTILDHTPADAAIVAGHFDKLLWPERIVSFRLPRTPDEWDAFRQLATTRPIFLYVTPRQYRLSDLQRQLAPRQMSITRDRVIGGDELWRVSIR